MQKRFPALFCNWIWLGGFSSYGFLINKKRETGDFPLWTNFEVRVSHHREERRCCRGEWAGLTHPDSKIDEFHHVWRKYALYSVFKEVRRQSRITLFWPNVKYCHRICMLWEKACVTSPEPYTSSGKLKLMTGFFFLACVNSHSFPWSTSPLRFGVNAVRNLSYARGRLERLGLKWCAVPSISIGLQPVTT